MKKPTAPPRQIPTKAAIQGADEEAGAELRPQIVQDQQVGGSGGVQQGLLLAGGVGAEVQRFQPPEEIGAGNIDDVVILLQHDARNGQGRVGLAQPGVAEEHQALAVVVELLGVAAQLGQQAAHVAAHRLAQLVVLSVGVVAQLHGVEAGNGQAGQRLDLLPAEFLHQFVDAGAGVPLKAAGVLTLRAGEPGFQCIGRAAAGGQQVGEGLSGLCQSGGCLGAVLAGSPGQCAPDAPHPHLVLGMAQGRDGGFRLGPGILGVGPG